ncbi:MAG: hypothetical protein ACUVTF_09125, partial [bacterium]
MEVKKKLRFERMDENNISVVKQWFRLPFFYFDTYEPDKITMKELDFILRFNKAHYFVINYNDRLVGLIDFIFLNNTGVTFEIAFAEQRYWREVGDEIIKKLLKNLFYNYPILRAEKWVYEFDSVAKETLLRV